MKRFQKWNDTSWQPHFLSTLQFYYVIKVYYCEFVCFICLQRSQYHICYFSFRSVFCPPPPSLSSSLKPTSRKESRVHTRLLFFFPSNFGTDSRPPSSKLSIAGCFFAGGWGGRVVVIYDDFPLQRNGKSAEESIRRDGGIILRQKHGGRSHPAAFQVLVTSQHWTSVTLN